jgi:hypothetical protein
MAHSASVQNHRVAAKQDIVIVSKTTLRVLKNVTVVLIVVRIRLLRTIKNCRNQELTFVLLMI